MDLGVLSIIILGISVGFFVQTVMGFAGALTALPIMLIGMELQDAIAYISIFYLFSSIFLISKEWQNIDKKIIARLALASVIGVFLGIMVLSYGKPIVLKKALGFFIILNVGYTLIGKDKYKPSFKLEVPFGVLGGFFSGVFSTGGPLYAICIKNTVTDIKTFRATMIGVLGLVTIVRIPMLSFNGVLNVTHLKYSLFVFPFFLFAQFLGKKIYLKLNEALFKKTLLVLLFLSGIALMLKS